MVTFSAQAELIDRLQALNRLNPDLSQTDRERLRFLAGQVEKECFASIAEVVTQLADACENTDVKRLGRAIMQEYFFHLEAGAQKLIQQGDIAAPQTSSASGCFTTALVPRTQTNALDYCRVLNRSSVPRDLEKAATAYLRRSHTVDSVLEEALRVLWIIDRNATVRWICDYYKQHNGALDPENVRDTLKVLLSENVVAYPPELIEWICHFADDDNLLEYWPKITILADRVLHRHALTLWYQETPRRNLHLAQLNFYVRNGRWEEDRLLAWTRHALAELGNAVTRFLSFEKADLSEEWRSVALLTELNRIADLFTPTILLADTMLALPDGAEKFAMAFLGLSGESGRDWEAALLRRAESAVKWFFVLDMKAGRPPVQTIERLSFGDPAALRSAMSALDLGSQQFESISQREKVVKLLAVYYASYRRSKFLMMEIGKRYRSLMRMIHEDFLTPRLTKEQLTQIQDKGILLEIATLATESKRFLERRQIKENSLEELLAAKIAFDHLVRKKRLMVFRRLQETSAHQGRQ